MAGRPLRKSTIEALKENPNLFRMILSRIAGAWEEDADRASPPKPQEVLREMGLSYGAFLSYVHEDAQRYEMWLRALETRAQLYAEEMIEIADTAEKDNAHLAKLKIDARQRIIKAWHKRLYGDDPLIQVNQVVSDPAQVAAKIVELEKRLGLRADEAPIAIEAPQEASSEPVI